MPKWVVADLRILTATGKRKDFDRQLINDALIILSHGRRIHVCLRRVTLAAQMKKVHDLTNEETHMRDLFCTGRRAVLATVLVTNVW